MELTQNLLIQFSLIAVCLIVPTACTKSDLIRIVVSKNPKAATKAILKSRPSRYQRNPRLLARDIKFAKARFNKLFKRHKKKASKRWGSSESKMPSTYQYVKYTNHYKSRAIINFDSGTLRIETLEIENHSASLKKAIITTLLTPQDPRAVDLFSAKTVNLRGAPYLYGLVRDHRGHFIKTNYQSRQYANYLLRHKLRKRVISENSKNITVYFVQLQMIRLHQKTRAVRYRHIVRQYSRQYNISQSLVYSIIQTESNFNPYAVSNAPAYGLMQIVPHSGGRDAYRLIHRKDRIPSKEYLFNERNNIRMGVAYFHLLYYKYLAAIRNPLTREYCAIAAYNTGAGNVFKAFSTHRKTALNQINKRSPSEVYNYLRKRLKYREARRYLYKVVKTRAQFTHF